MIRIYEQFATKADAEAFRDRYYASYAPMGYGTHIKIKEETVAEPDNGGAVSVVWIASGSRGASCD